MSGMKLLARLGAAERERAQRARVSQPSGRQQLNLGLIADGVRIWIVRLSALKGEIIQRAKHRFGTSGADCS
jgi:hypothetical protein